MHVPSIRVRVCTQEIRAGLPLPTAEIPLMTETTTANHSQPQPPAKVSNTHTAKLTTQYTFETKVQMNTQLLNRSLTYTCLRAVIPVLYAAITAV